MLVVRADNIFLSQFKNRLILLLTLLCLQLPSYAAEIILFIRPLAKTDFKEDYTRALLFEVLNKTKQAHADFLITYSEKVSPLRAKILMMEEGYGDVTPSAVRTDWNKDLIQVNIPILKGIQGLRVLLIHQDMEKTFAKVTSLEQLKKLSLGTGFHWSITKTFQHHNFNLITFTEYDALFNMLENKRFDYATRGLNEILEELKIHKVKQPNLRMEKTILLNVPLPLYFYVNPHKPELAKRITKGLEIMIKDGTFDKLFNEHYGYITTEFDIENRKLFNIKNPYSDSDNQVSSSLEIIKLKKSKNAYVDQ